MPDEPFIMMSLKDDKAKKLANVLTNKSASQILNFLATHDGATESEIAKKLKLPLSTVNYNMKSMVEAKLVVADEYHYSTRGKEVNHYKLARKYIIIAPEDEKEGFLNRIKKYVPITLVALGVGVVAKILSLFTYGALAGSSALSADAMPKMAIANEIQSVGMEEGARVLMDGAGAQVASDVAVDAVNRTATDTATQFAARAPEALHTVSYHSPSFWQSLFGDWFGFLLLGIFLFLLVALLIEYVMYKRK